MLDSASVARKMSWAATREITRVENRAYSLMGIFGIYMFPIYGEGDNAFLRLQEEIVRTIPDQSILAWGRGCTISTLVGTKKQLSVSGTGRPTVFDGHGLLANSSEDFADFGSVISLDSSRFTSLIKQTEGKPPPLQSVLTPQGVEMQLMCINLERISQPFDCTCSADPLVLENMHKKHHHARTLALLPCALQDANHNDYVVALPLSGHRDDRALRVVSRSSFLHEHRGLPGPFRVILLRQSSVKEALKHLALWRTSILRHSVCKRDSELHPYLPLPKLRPTTGPSLFWPKDPHHNAAFRLAPHCTDTTTALFSLLCNASASRSSSRLLSVLTRDAFV